jgi:hypothetical protein
MFVVCVTGKVFNTDIVYGSLELCTPLGSFRSVKITCVDYFVYTLPKCYSIPDLI